MDFEYLIERITIISYVCAYLHIQYHLEYNLFVTMSSNALKHRKTTIGKKTSTQNHVEQHVEASINPIYEQLFYTSLETMTDHMPYVLISNVISLDPKIFNSTKFQSMTDFVQAKGDPRYR
jgi:hypothetical protein